MARFTYNDNILVYNYAAIDDCVQKLYAAGETDLSVISIMSREDTPARLFGAHRVLRLTFDDEEQTDQPNMAYGRILTPISHDEARIIAAFVDAVSGPLIVQCPGGVSRSAGVAAGIIEAYGGDASRIFETKCPNMTCYRRVFDACCTYTHIQH